MSSDLKIENLFFKNVLKNINLSIKQGTINVLMGPSGSGKTLLLKSIVGLVDYTGSVSLNNKIITRKNNRELIKKIGLYIDLNIFENEDVFQYLMRPLINLEYKENDARNQVFDLTKKLCIENLLYKKIPELSFAQKKVVSFAQSIIHGPKIILIDDLFDSLDKYYKDIIIKYLKQLNNTKKVTIIFTTNNSEDLLLANHLIIIKNGETILYEDINKVLEDEKKLTNKGIKLPFIIDLSHKLRLYNLIDEIVFDMDEMVDKIWK